MPLLLSALRPVEPSIRDRSSSTRELGPKNGSFIYLIDMCHRIYICMCIYVLDRCIYRTE